MMPEKRSSGTMYEVVNESNAEPLEVILTGRTVLKIVSWIIGPLLIVISSAIFFFHKTNLHMDDKVIHLAQDERPKIETKVSAAEKSKKVVQEIKNHVNIQYRELKVEQKAQINKMTDELKENQAVQMRRMIREFRRFRD